MNPEEFSSLIIDICAEKDVVEDFDLEIHENVVVRAEISLSKGFVNVYRNFVTDKIAFAWIVDEKRIYGADNTGGWHVHPLENPSGHVGSEPISLKKFVNEVRGQILSRK
ncbi:hypothetical protein AKJ61_03505 [candidate division MSBL1 archaeon SCGC-AAA259B11]|uniref:Uncharacterized protein n=1 Tax=candidate division MSBL1 archaeon SCGC-AAA259B11 TaxID=1698260 RepID=A0A133U4J1_9EURY|nr:hypothetical protein AKJ61_03505 [candidate division MSBL1 archaeon SCGC-AAA259B11]